jgi:hypothetical protein
MSTDNFEKNFYMKYFIILSMISICLFGCSTNNNGTVTFVPLAPTNLNGAVISSTQINLSWTDNATTEDGYKIERKTGAGSYAVIGSTTTNLSTFSDLGLNPNTSYTYRIYAYNSAGNSVQYSNEITIATQDSIPSWLTNGLVAYYPFNGNANDESGNGNNGTVNGATLTTDRFSISNSAYSFNGSSYIRVLNNSLFNFGTSDYTLSAWAMRQGSNQYQDIISKQMLGPTYTGWGLNFIYDYPRFESGTTYNGTWLTNGNINNIGGQYTNPILNNTWYHLVAVFNSTNSVVKLYINGVLSITKPTSGTLINPDNINDLFFGVYQPNGAPSGPEFLTGKIDHIRIYNRALSASEIAYLAIH